MHSRLVNSSGLGTSNATRALLGGRAKRTRPSLSLAREAVYGAEPRLTSPTGATPPRRLLRKWRLGPPAVITRLGFSSHEVVVEVFSNNPDSRLSLNRIFDMLRTCGTIVSAFDDDVDGQRAIIQVNVAKLEEDDDNGVNRFQFAFDFYDEAAVLYAISLVRSMSRHADAKPEDLGTYSLNIGGELQTYRIQPMYRWLTKDCTWVVRPETDCR